MPQDYPTGAFGARHLPWLLVTIAGIAYFTGLGAYTLFDPDEGRYAQMPREILLTGDYITPHLNCANHYHKPPLYYWLGAASMALFGPNEFSARFAPALSGFLTFLIVLAFGRRVLSERGGLVAAGAYLTSLVPLGIARVPNTDGLFSLTLTATWACWYLGYDTDDRRASRRWFLVAWVCLGLATMTKGIVALVLTGLIVVGFLLLRRDLRALGRMAWWPGVPLFALITVPWYVVVSLRNPDFLHYHFVVQHFARFFGGKEYYVSDEHAQPVWFFVAVVLVGLGGWMLPALPAALQSLRSALGGIRLLRRVPEVEDRAGQLSLFCAIWALAVVGFFSLSAAKLITYVLPAFPAIALLLGQYVEGGGLRRWGGRVALGLMGALSMAAGLAVPSFAESQDAVPAMVAVTATGPLYICLVLAGILLVAAALVKPQAGALAAGVFTLGLVFSAVCALPAAAPYLQAGYLVKHLPTPLPQDARVAEWRTYSQSIGFYTGRRMVLVDKSGELFDRIGKPDGPPEWFPSGAESLERLAREGPVLLNLNRENWGDWCRTKASGLYRPIAANSVYVLLGNDALIAAMGLRPWPLESVTKPPVLLPARTQAG